MKDLEATKEQLSQLRKEADRDKLTMSQLKADLAASKAREREGLEGHRALERRCQRLEAELTAANEEAVASQRALRRLEQHQSLLDRVGMQVREIRQDRFESARPS